MGFLLQLNQPRKGSGFVRAQRHRWHDLPGAGVAVRAVPVSAALGLSLGARRRLCAALARGRIDVADDGFLVDVGHHFPFLRRGAVASTTSVAPMHSQMRSIPSTDKPPFPFTNLD